jgi:hypothetical protein
MSGKVKILAAAIAMGGLVNSFSAFADGPIALKTDVIVQNVATCKFEVAHSGATTAQALYQKGATLSESRMNVTEHESLITVQAMGGDQCVIRDVKIKATDDTQRLEGDPSTPVLLTRDGKGFIPMHYVLRNVEAFDAKGEALDAGYLNLLDGFGQATSLASYMAVPFPPKTAVVGTYKGKEQYAAAGVTALIQDNANASILNTDLTGIRYGDDLSKAMGYGPHLQLLSDGELPTKVEFAVTAVPGDGFYSVETGLRDDEVVADDEKLSVTSTVTVTPL